MVYNRALVASGYLAAIALVLFALLDTTIAVLPAQPRLAQWRFAAAGLYSRSLPVLLLGFGIGIALAAALRHRRMLRLLAVLAALGSALLVAAAGLFLLDAIEVHGIVATEGVFTYRATALAAFVRMLAASLILLVAARGAWLAARAILPARRPDPGATPPLYSSSPLANRAAKAS